MICTVTQKKLLKALFYFSFLASLWACQKEISYEVKTSQGTTVSDTNFVLAPSGSDCSDAAAIGNFQAGAVLTTATILMVTVDVKKAGDWKYTTPTVNGFSFSGTGTFTTTGSQSITLTATGTPLSAGITTFPLHRGAANCSLVVPISPAGSAGTGTVDYYYKATIGGINYRQDVTETNGFEPGAGSGGVDDVSFGAGVTYSNPPLPKGLTEMGVSKGMFHNNISASNADFKAFFKPGNYTYHYNTLQHPDGVIVSWTDTNGDNWDTESGTGDQTGSAFKIISVVDDYDAIGRYYVKVKMQFNCKLYNETTGVMKPLLNGELVASFGRR